LVYTTHAGEKHDRIEQIQQVVPHTMLSLKAGFPPENRRLRGTDEFLYLALLRHFNQDRRRLADEFLQLIGSELRVTPLRNGLNVEPIDDVPLDTLQRLSVEFLRPMKMSQPEPGDKTPAYRVDALAPAVVTQLADDFMLFVRQYSAAMPRSAFNQAWQGLIGLLLLDYTLEVTRMIPALRNGNPPAEWLLEERPRTGRIFLDLSDGTDAISVQLARSSVTHDLETLRAFYEDSLYFRQLHLYAIDLADEEETAETIRALPSPQSGYPYLAALREMHLNSAARQELLASARHDIRRIKDTTLKAAEAAPIEDDPFRAITIGTRDALEKLVRILAVAQQQNPLPKQEHWLSGVGGLDKPYSLIAGSRSQRRTWRYAPTNDMLVLLVQLAAAHQVRNGAARDGRIPLRGFLQFLEQRFGMLVDRPPPGFHGPEYNAAASRNLRVLQRRLQQMGLFDDLSDDFTVQSLDVPYLNRTPRNEGRYA
jgi:hypothetical protein